MSGNSYDEMSDTDQVSKMQESSEDEDADFYSIHTTSKLSTSIRASMQLEITDSEYSDFEGFDKFLEDDRSIEDNPKDNSENLVTTQPSDTDERVMEKKQKWLPIIRKKILRKNVLKSGQSGSRSSNDQSILPQETPSVTRPEIMDRDLRDSSQFLENDTSIEDHDTNSTTSEDHVTPQPTDTEEGTVENKQSSRSV
ncbi:uncharacterized protein LOC143449596 [Clavelina lepadiformis]|uniref:uncharacterized protein LOC143449596 n=1 Tax=Clavelina lepadiformis TaxID=159417 RepID=UPI0040432B2B